MINAFIRRRCDAALTGQEDAVGAFVGDDLDPGGSALAALHLG